MMKKSILGMMAFGVVLSIGDYQPGSPFGGLSLVREAHAVVGRPMTPVSVAGVARRTTRRTIYATSVYVATLPPACTVVVIEGTTLQQCGGTYYQASGSQYVVVNVQ
jgi:formate hydrogenlyase subunit 4